jgi:hypothetical protein
MDNNQVINLLYNMFLIAKVKLFLQQGFQAFPIPLMEEITGLLYVIALFTP